MRTQVDGNALELALSRSDAALIILSLMMVGLLGLLESWNVAFVAFGASALGAGVVALIQIPQAQGDPRSEALPIPRAPG